MSDAFDLMERKGRFDSTSKVSGHFLHASLNSPAVTLDAVCVIQISAFFFVSK